MIYLKKKELVPAKGISKCRGWWGHQPGRPVVGGVSTAHFQRSDATY